MPIVVKNSLERVPLGKKEKQRVASEARITTGDIKRPHLQAKRGCRSLKPARKTMQDWLEDHIAAKK
jgi:hypothetical protein